MRLWKAGESKGEHWERQLKEESKRRERRKSFSFPPVVLHKDKCKYVNVQGEVKEAVLTVAQKQRSS